MGDKINMWDKEGTTRRFWWALGFDFGACWEDMKSDYTNRATSTIMVVQVYGFRNPPMVLALAPLSHN
ncbi:predicted protein [Lichtheimia corymbifera JMRC:FSU:9682]|uniref:Uncharacterized protein n=1 Tax=Lichtheimia corymbifera JMRC:FSU:9682 TaxID=1263082 RepID=A0A068SIC8_9FUNG|nr:predicted protein [Lichtheimia corymbifera JMRC:FSU:9682]